MLQGDRQAGELAYGCPSPSTREISSTPVAHFLMASPAQFPLAGNNSCYVAQVNNNRAIDDGFLRPERHTAVRRFLRRGLQTFQILEWHETQPEDTLEEFWDKSSALDFLRGFMRDHSNINTLRKTLAGVSRPGALSRLADNDVIKQVAWRLVSGQVRVARSPRAMGTWGYGSGVTKTEPREEPPLTAPPVTPPVKPWIEIQLLDMEGNPVSGKHYLVRDSGGQERRGVLDSDGSARLEGLQGGYCDVSFPELDGGAWERV